MGLIFPRGWAFRAGDRARPAATRTHEMTTDVEVGTMNQRAGGFASAKMVTSNVKPEVR